MLNSDLIKKKSVVVLVSLSLSLSFFFPHGTPLLAEHQRYAEYSLGKAADVLGVHEPNIRTKRHPSISYSIRFTLYHVPDPTGCRYSSPLGSFQPNPEILIS